MKDLIQSMIIKAYYVHIFLKNWMCKVLNLPFNFFDIYEHNMLLWSFIDLGPSPLIILVKIIHLFTIFEYNISRKWSTIKEISLVWKKAMSFLSNEKCHYADIENRYSKGTIPYINLVFKVNIVTYLYVFSWHLGFWVLM